MTKRWAQKERPVLAGGAGIGTFAETQTSQEHGWRSSERVLLLPPISDFQASFRLTEFNCCCF